MEEFTRQEIVFCVTYASNGNNATHAARVARYEKPVKAGKTLLQRDDIVKKIKSIRTPVIDPPQYWWKRLG